KRDLYLAGLLPMTGVWPGGQAMMVAADMALERINQRDDVLGDYRLNLMYGDSEFLVYKGVHLLHQFLSEEPIKLAVVAAANSELSEASSLISELYHLIQVSYASVSPILSNKEIYPRFFRTSSPDTLVNPARIALCEEFGWKKVAVLQQSRTVFDAVAENLKNRIENHPNISILASEVFQSDPLNAVSVMKEKDVRIVFTICNMPQAQQILCQAFKNGMVGPKYVWFMPGWFDDNWWLVDGGHHDCTVQEMTTAAEGYMAVADLTLSAFEGTGISGLTSTEYWSEFNRLTNYQSPHATNLATQMFDALWAIALALNDNEQLKDQTKDIYDFRYDDIEMSNMILNNMKRIKFNGVKSPIEFDEKQDPVIVVKIERVQNGSKDLLGYWGRGATTDLEWTGSTLIWEGGRNRPPVDSTRVSYRKVFVPLEIYLLFSILSAISMLIAVLFLAINLYHRKTRVIKMSSPNINNIILLGCFLVYLTAFFQERDSSSVLLYCKLRSYVMVIGFALAFGALFSKTWRIHIIFANKKLKRKVVKDARLIVMVLILLAVDLIVLISWDLVDPPGLVATEIYREQSQDGDLLTVYEKDQCQSVNSEYFIYTLYIIQGLLLIFGAFLAWETRKVVTIPALNDSQLIGVCIYNVFVLSVMAVILSAVLNTRVTLSYCVMSTISILATNTTACIIFVPKV
ncbi:hypothetical protein CAPTEDRAFT_42446, partial [Capitella teleta]